MQIHIMSRETIKPSSPTPLHLKIHKLSLLDQLAPDIYYPIFLFYSGAAHKWCYSGHLKNSLSKTLNHYYPFAGRVLEDDFTIACDDSGVSFIEAHVANYQMSQVLDRAEVHQLKQLMPSEAKQGDLSAEDVMVAVQVNHFSCGGVAICVCVRHVIADATAASHFIKTWAALARSGCGGGGSSGNSIMDVIFDCATIFPKQDMPELWGRILENVMSLGEPNVKRFKFEGAKIDALREKISCHGWRPTRFEAVSALIWGAAVAAARERDDFTPNVAFISVDLRKRMNPSLPKQRIGNIYQRTMATWPMEKEEKIINYNSLARRLHESIGMITDDNAKKLNEGGGILEELRNLNESNSELNVFFLSGWCRLPLYEADFGWGKPTWVSTAVKYNNIAYLLDTCDGKGIEAWVGLPQQDMATFENNADILAYASFNDSILGSFEK